MNQAIFDRYAHNIPKNSEFKSINDAETQCALFHYWKNNFTGKAIRTALGINYAIWQTYITAFQDPENPQPIAPGRRGRNTVSSEPAKPPKAPEVDSKGRIIIDAEVIEIEAQTKSENLPAVTAPAASESPKSALVSIDTTDIPERICDQLTALLAFLRFQKESITIKLEVFK